MCWPLMAFLPLPGDARSNTKLDLKLAAESVSHVLF
jgi:hypothetical protein